MGEEGEDDWPLDGDESGDEYSDESDIFGEASSSSSQSEESSDSWGNNDDLADQPRERQQLEPQESFLKRLPPEVPAPQHPLLDQIQKLCRQLKQEFNAPDKLDPLLLKVRQIGLPRVYQPTEVRELPEDSENLRLVEAHAEHAKEYDVTLTFDFEPAPLGTFDCIKADGEFPDPDIGFNALQTDLTADLTPYEVWVDTEVPLPLLKETYLSVLFTPTHKMTSSGCYVTKGDMGGPRVMYYLPPGYYRRFQLQVADSEQHVEFMDQLTLPGSGKKLHVNVLEEGFFFCDGKTFFLPQGCLLTPEPVQHQWALTQLGEWIAQNQVRCFITPNPSVVDEKRQENIEKYEKSLDNPQITSVVKFHCERIGISYTSFLRNCIVQLRPTLERLDGEFANQDPSMLIQIIEISAYDLQKQRLRCYYGPAPPFKEQNRGAVKPRGFPQRMINSKGRHSKPKPQPIAPDGLPRPRKPSRKLQSPLTRQQEPQESGR